MKREDFGKIKYKENPWPDWIEGKCEVCNEICVNQFLPQFESILYRWRAGYWTKNIVCTLCVDGLTDEEVRNLE